MRGTSRDGQDAQRGRQISIHVPLAGNVLPLALISLSATVFLSTFPLRGTSECQPILYQPRGISIHVPLAGNVRDDDKAFDTVGKYFYPRSPCGERPKMFAATSPVAVFLSTFPLRGTSMIACCQPSLKFYFYPRSPCGERPLAQRQSHCLVIISIHVPLAGNVNR